MRAPHRIEITLPFIIWLCNWRHSIPASLSHYALSLFLSLALYLFLSLSLYLSIYLSASLSLPLLIVINIPSFGHFFHVYTYNLKSVSKIPRLQMQYSGHHELWWYEPSDGMKAEDLKSEENRIV